MHCIQYKGCYIEEINWNIHTTYLLSGESLKSFVTLLKRDSAVIILWGKEICDAFKLHSLSIQERWGQIIESYQKFSFLLNLWDPYEELIHYYPGISSWSSLYLVHHFQYFVILGRSQHSFIIHWYPVWFLACHFISIYFFHLGFDEASYSRKGSATRLLWVICV